MERTEQTVLNVGCHVVLVSNDIDGVERIPGFGSCLSCAVVFVFSRIWDFGSWYLGFRLRIGNFGIATSPVWVLTQTWDELKQGWESVFLDD